MTAIFKIEVEFTADGKGQDVLINEAWIGLPTGLVRAITDREAPFAEVIEKAIARDHKQIVEQNQGMTIGEAREIAALFGGNRETLKNPAIGKYCIVRCRNAGVHAGTVVESNAEFAVLRSSRRMWRWKSNFTLSEAAKYGIDASSSKIAAEIDVLIIPMLDIAEFIPCTKEAECTITEAEEYHV